MSNCEDEARKRWGNTDVYREHTEKTKNYTKEKWASVAEGMDSIFARFVECKTSGASADSEAAQALAAELQGYITQNFYNCTDEILKGLGQMYVADERFKKNIDKHGDGTAEFSAEAIAAYVK
ncbi:MAG: TipAS antibiotic-recognition domain-containing protein [Clostridia bacterium]|nr:TipAS antibiotic-recognition domain-containing protein [Clostridia bacterium]